MIRFATLGPSESNHQFVTERYLAFHGLGEIARISLFEDFSDGVADLLNARADFIVQCAVHPATPATVAEGLRGIEIVDTFVSPSRALAIVRRRDVAAPRRIAVMPATADYTELSGWEQVLPTKSVADVAQGLRDGHYEAGLTYASLARDSPDRFCIVDPVGTVDDAWIVYGRKTSSAGSLKACRDGRAAALFEAMRSELSDSQ